MEELLDPVMTHVCSLCLVEKSFANLTDARNCVCEQFGMHVGFHASPKYRI